MGRCVNECVGMWKRVEVYVCGGVCEKVWVLKECVYWKRV